MKNLETPPHMTAEESKKRIFHTLDGMRGIAAIFVVIWHSSKFFGENVVPSAYLAVDLFFLMSGVVLSFAYDSRIGNNLEFWKFFLLRIVRLFPLYLLGTMIAVLSVSAALIAHIPVLWTWPELLRSVVAAIFMIPIYPPKGIGSIFPLNGPAWSLFYEIIINFIYAFTLPWIGIKTLIGVVVTSILLMGVAVFYYGSLKIGDSIGGGVYTGGILRVTFSFFCGVLLCRLYRKNVIPRMSVKSPWLILILMAILLVMNPSRDIRPYYDIIAVAFAFPLLVGAALSTEPKQFYRVFTFLGIISYPVYALHAGLGRIALRGMDKLASMGFAIPVPYSGLVLLVCLAVIAYCADRFFDAPVRTFLNKRVLMLGQKNQAMSRKD